MLWCFRIARFRSKPTKPMYLVLFYAKNSTLSLVQVCTIWSPRSYRMGNLFGTRLPTVLFRFRWFSKLSRTAKPMYAGDMNVWASCRWWSPDFFDEDPILRPSGVMSWPRSQCLESPVKYKTSRSFGQREAGASAEFKLHITNGENSGIQDWCPARSSNRNQCFFLLSEDLGNIIIPSPHQEPLGDISGFVLQFANE